MSDASRRPFACRGWRTRDRLGIRAGGRRFSTPSSPGVGPAGRQVPNQPIAATQVTTSTSLGTGFDPGIMLVRSRPHHRGPFLDYCREHHRECNYLAWHYTGWDPHYPEQARWRLGRLRELIAEYPEQRIREIHCDEWGAGPDKPGRLHPGRAVVWFHYLENVYNVDRACRANWGREDDYLGGLVDADGCPFPVYHVYRLYAGMGGQTRVATEGNSRTIACLASRAQGRWRCCWAPWPKDPAELSSNCRDLTRSPCSRKCGSFPTRIWTSPWPRPTSRCWRSTLGNDKVPCCGSHWMTWPRIRPITSFCVLPSGDAASRAVADKMS